MMLALAGMRFFNILTQEGSQEYIQSEYLTRDLNVKDHKISGLGEEKGLNA